MVLRGHPKDHRLQQWPWLVLLLISSQRWVSYAPVLLWSNTFPPSLMFSPLTFIFFISPVLLPLPPHITSTPYRNHPSSSDVTGGIGFFPFLGPCLASSHLCTGSHRQCHGYLGQISFHSGKTLSTSSSLSSTLLLFIITVVIVVANFIVHVDYIHIIIASASVLWH